MALKVNSDLRFEFMGLFPLCKHNFFTPKASYRLFVTFGNRNKKAMCRPAAAGKNPANTTIEDGDLLPVGLKLEKSNTCMEELF